MSLDEEVVLNGMPVVLSLVEPEIAIDRSPGTVYM